MSRRQDPGRRGRGGSRVGRRHRVLVNRGRRVDDVGIVMDEAPLPDDHRLGLGHLRRPCRGRHGSEEAEGEHGEFSGDSGFIDRDVTLDIDEVLWSRPQPSKPLPEAVTVDAVGWSYDRRGHL